MTIRRNLLAFASLLPPHGPFRLSATHALLSLHTRTAFRPFSFSYPVPRKLKDVMKLPLVEREDRHTVIALWRKHLSCREGITPAAITDVALFDEFAKNVKCSPLFVAPLYKSQLGFVTLLLQTQDPKSVLVTTLEHYKRFGDRSIPVLVCTFYDELRHSKGLILARADITANPLLGPCSPVLHSAPSASSSAAPLQLISQEESKQLLHYVIHCYTNPSMYTDFVKPFNHTPRSFRFDDLVATVKRNPDVDGRGFCFRDSAKVLVY